MGDVCAARSYGCGGHERGVSADLFRIWRGAPRDLYYVCVRKVGEIVLGSWHWV